MFDLFWGKQIKKFSLNFQRGEKGKNKSGKLENRAGFALQCAFLLSPPWTESEICSSILSLPWKRKTTSLSEVEGWAGRELSYLSESECGLYSIGKLAGRLRIRLSTSLIRFVLPTSMAVRFQTDSKSSGYWVERTMPQISEPTRNCSPNIAIQTFSQARLTLFFLNRRIHLPPLMFSGSSHIGLMPLLKRCNLR